VKKLYLLVMGLCALGLPVEGAKMHAHAKKEESVATGPKIRVLLAKNANSALLEAKGSYRVVQRENEELISAGLVGKRYLVHAIANGLRWGEEYPGVDHVTIIPASKETSFFVNGFQYCGLIDVYIDQNHQISIVNEVPIEDYVRATVALQVSEGMQKEALAAYIIAARTEAYALALSGQKADRSWDVRAKDVGYFGNGVALQQNGVEEACEATRYMVLESTRAHMPEPVKVMPSKLEELASMGMDAKTMLKKCFPQAQLNVTTQPPAKIIR
jgi:hypothetical protein